MSYDNRNVIPDPDNPSAPKWAVRIPSAVKFTEDRKSADTTIELVGTDGNALETGISVDVTVASANGYTLNGAGQELPYELYAEGLLITGAANEEITLATLTDTDTKKPGNALLKGTATSLNVYTDTLTYKATKN